MFTACAVSNGLAVSLGLGRELVAQFGRWAVLTSGLRISLQRHLSLWADLWWQYRITGCLIWAGTIDLVCHLLLRQPNNEMRHPKEQGKILPKIYKAVTLYSNSLCNLSLIKLSDFQGRGTSAFQWIHTFFSGKITLSERDWEKSTPQASILH